jgi:hypothetical protein
VICTSRDNTASDRRRLLSNLTVVATLAARLAAEDLGDAASGRAHYSVALDNAREANDNQAAATVLGYTTQLAHAEGMTTAAMDHLDAALAHAERAPAIAPWLTSIQATIHADSGDHTAAVDALHRAPSPRPLNRPYVRCYCSITARLTWLPRLATFTSTPVTTPQPGPRWPTRSINSHPPPAAPASSHSPISP